MNFSMMSKGGINMHLYARLGRHIKGELSTLTRSKEKFCVFYTHHSRGNFEFISFLQFSFESIDLFFIHLSFKLISACYLFAIIKKGEIVGLRIMSRESATYP